MPRRFYRRRAHYRRRRTVRVRRSLPLNGFPASQLTRHRYCDNINLYQALPGTPEFYLYGANNGYDPDHSGTGHQPMGWDQMAAIYGDYAVVGSKITIRATPVEFFRGAGTGTVAPYNYPFYFGIFRDDNDAALYNLEALREQATSSWGTTTLDHPGKRSCSYSAKRQYGPDWLSQSSASYNNNPPDGTFFDIWICCAETGEGHGTCAIEVTLEFIVLWTNRKEMGQS